MLDGIYAYCTDFIISLSHLIGLSYVEVNFALFIVLYPILALALTVAWVWQRRIMLKFHKK